MTDKQIFDLIKYVMPTSVNTMRKDSITPQLYTVHYYMI